MNHLGTLLRRGQLNTFNIRTVNQRNSRLSLRENSIQLRMVGVQSLIRFFLGDIATANRVRVEGISLMIWYIFG